MNKKERKRIEVTLKQILYFIDKPEKQKEVIALLDECESKMHDSKIKNAIDNFRRKFKEHDYFKLVDFLVDDILSSKIGLNEKVAIDDLVKKLNNVIDDACKSLKDELFDLFDWS